MKPRDVCKNHRIMSLGLVLLMIGCCINPPSSSTFLVERQSYVPMQATDTWQIQNHSYFLEDTIFRDVYFVNSTHGWVVGQNETGLRGGIILNTEDGGDTWHLQLYNYFHKFTSIDSQDGQTIWIAGRSGLVYSFDGGQTWNDSVVVESTPTIGAVKFINETHGWTSTMNDVYRTIDGGQTWLNVTTWTFDDTLKMIHFTTKTEAYAIGIYGIYHSEDSCKTWEQQYSLGGWSLSFVNESEAWAVADGWLAKMDDSETWVEQPIPRSTSGFGLSSPPYFTDIFFIDQMHGWIVGLETPVAYTPNGGATWYSQQVPDEMDRRMMAVYFVNNTLGWAVGSGGYIMRTTSGNSLGVLLQTTSDFPFALPFVEIGVLIVLVIAGGTAIYYLKYRRKSEPSVDNSVL